MLRRHALIAAAFAALPLAEPLLGRGPAFTMYASSLEFRLEVSGRRAGLRVPIPPSSLGHRLPPSARAFALGAERFRRISDVSVLRRHLDDFARLACDQDRSFEEVDVVLVERTRLDEKKTSAHWRCGR